ncbi:MAG: hypothetical protein R2850_06770 [Bacteroidia bacterium]
MLEGFGSVTSALITGAVCIGLAIFALSGLKETFGRDLDYIEAL